MKNAAVYSFLVLTLVNWATCQTDAGGVTLTSKSTTGNVAKAYTSAYSCSSASAASYGGVAIAYSSANSAAIVAAANACAKAVTDAFVSAGAGCKSTDVSVFMSTAALACARSSIALRTSSVATALSAGRAKALANACAYSSAFSLTYAKAIAQAMANGFAQNGAGCDAYTSAAGDIKLQAAAKAMTSGLAGSFAYASTIGNGASKAASSALYAADVSVYASVIGELFAYGCTKCAQGASCKFCADGYADGDTATTESLAIAAKGRVALASAFSDAVSAVCHKTATVQAAASSCLQAVGEVCIQIAARACGWASATGNAAACQGSYATGSAYGVSEAFGSLVADAAALAFSSNTCAQNAFSTITQEVFAKVQILDVVKAVQSACIASNGPSVTYSAAASALKLSNQDVYSNALSTAISAVVTQCECAGDGYCCNCKYRNPQCVY